RWLTPEATDMTEEQWRDANARCIGLLLEGRAQATGIKRPSMDATALLVLNAHHDVVKFRLPEVLGGRHWRRLIDTSVPDAEGLLEARTGDEHEVAGRSVLLFALEPEHTASVAMRRVRQALRQVAEAPATVPASAPGSAASEAERPREKSRTATTDAD
ncbi:MAG: glycogen debranching protein GlgX, partial [Acetobacteraceae bacterium]